MILLNSLFRDCSKDDIFCGKLLTQDLIKYNIHKIEYMDKMKIIFQPAV